MTNRIGPERNASKDKKMPGQAGYMFTREEWKSQELARRASNEVYYDTLLDTLNVASMVVP